MLKPQPSGIIELSLVNESDNKYRMVDVLYSTYSNFNREKFFSDEYFRLYAPIVARDEVLLMSIDPDDTISGVMVLIDTYDNSRDDTPRRYVVLIDTVGEDWQMIKQSQVATIEFQERGDDLIIHETAQVMSKKSSREVRRMLSSRMDKAIDVAATAHADQKRKGSDTPYIIHPFGVMRTASFYTNDEDTLIACLMHDILEDVPEKYSRDQMIKDFGQRVVDIVDDVTKDSTIKDWRKRAEAYLANIRKASDEAIIVCASDKINNLGSIIRDYDRLGDDIWSIFNAGKDSQLWWYESIYEVVRKRMPNSLLRNAMGQRMKTLRKIIKNK